jgi:hypothetical protein
LGLQQLKEQQMVDTEWAILIELARNMRIPLEEVRQFIHNTQTDKCRPPNMSGQY